MEDLCGEIFWLWRSKVRLQIHHEPPPGRETVSGTTAARRSDPLTLARFNPNPDPDPDMEVRGELLTC